MTKNRRLPSMLFAYDHNGNCGIAENSEIRSVPVIVFMEIIFP